MAVQSLKNGRAVGPDGIPVEVLICEDSGSLSIWSKTKENPWQEWVEDKSVSEHEDGAMAVDCLHPGKEYVTVGADGYAKVWDMEDLICLRTYEAHSRPIHAVAARPDASGMFATASFDAFVVLWETKLSLPAIDLFKNDCGIRALQWIDDFRLVFGDDAGVLRLLDVRNTTQQNQSIKLADFPAGIHKLFLNAAKNKIAVCCDNNIVSVCNIDASPCQVSYHERHMHNNCVRGMAWDPELPNVLHSVGWDSVVQTHTVE